MGNPWAGDVALTVNGERHEMRLTLGALAELEESLGEAGLIPLIKRFEAGDFIARDLMALLLAGLRGGGAEVSAEDLARAEIAGGPVGAARAAARLLSRAFAVSE